MSDPYPPRFGEPITGWWRRFAWLPTDTVDRGPVWLRLVYRRRIVKHSYLSGGGPDFWFQDVVDTQEGNR